LAKSIESRFCVENISLLMFGRGRSRKRGERDRERVPLVGFWRQDDGLTSGDPRTPQRAVRTSVPQRHQVSADRELFTARGRGLRSSPRFALSNRLVGQPARRVGRPRRRPQTRRWNGPLACRVLRTRSPSLFPSEQVHEASALLIAQARNERDEGVNDRLDLIFSATGSATAGRA
jgi:hypothetical protein